MLTYRTTRETSRISQKQHFFQRLQCLETSLLGIESDIYRLGQQAKSIFDEKANVANYLQVRAQDTKSRLMLELKLFEKDVYELINRSSSETKKINDKIQNLKSGQINTLKMILSLQERVREIEVQLGNMESDD